MLCFNGFDITCLSICCPCVFLSLNLLVSLICLPFSSSNLYLPLCFHPLFAFQYSLCALLTSYLVSFLSSIISPVFFSHLFQSPSSCHLSSLITSSVLLSDFVKFTSSLYLSILLLSTSHTFSSPSTIFCGGLIVYFLIYTLFLPFLIYVLCSSDL